MRIAFFGSSLVSAYWNGAATYYRGLLRALSERGHEVLFLEPDAYQRQQNRDIADPGYARVFVWRATPEGLERALAEAASFRPDLLVKASGVGVFDDELEAAVLNLPAAVKALWDVDAPATLAAIGADLAHPSRGRVPAYDLVFTYGGGPKVVAGYRALGARACVPIHNALDPTTHFPVPREPRFACELGLLANRLPDREARIDEFFFQPAETLPEARFLLGGSGWEGAGVPGNVGLLGHVGTGDHNAFNSSCLAVLNVNRESMAAVGHSPPTRLFEVAGAAACLITDAWEGIDAFLEPDSEVLVAENGEEVAGHLERLRRQPVLARATGERARRRVLAEHTYDKRALEVEAVLEGRL